MEDEKKVLGIIGEIDLGDFGKSIDEIRTQLNSLGIDVSQISKKLEDELDSISKSSVDSAEKQRLGLEAATRAMTQMEEALQRGIERQKKWAEGYEESGMSADALIEELKKVAEQAGAAHDVISDLGRIDGGEVNIDDLKSALEEYGSLTKQVSDTAQAAYAQQQEYVQNLSNTIAALGEEMNMPEVDAEAFSQMQHEAQRLSDELERAETNLEVLSEAFENAKTEEEEAKAALDRFNDALNRTSDQSGSVKEAYAELGNVLKEAGSEFKNWLTGHGKFQEGIKQFKSQLSNLPLPIKQTTDSLKGMAVAMKAMIATPLGAAITAITLGLQALSSWFTKSAEGQKAFAKITAYVSSLLSSLSDIAVKLGKYIYGTFANSTGPLNAFGRNLVSFVIEPIKSVVKLVSGVGDGIRALYETAKSLKSGDFSKASELFKSSGNTLKESFKSAISALENGAKGVWNLGKGVAQITGDLTKTIYNADLHSLGSDMLSKARESAELASRQIEADIKISKAKEREAELDAEIAKSREKVYTLTGAERLAELQNLRKMQEEKYGERIKQYQELYDIQKRTNELHSSTLADEERERQLNIQLLQLKAQQAAATRMTARLEESTKRTAANADKRGKKNTEAVNTANASLSETIYSSEVARAKEIEASEDRLANVRIKAMAEGFERTKAEKRRQDEAELDAIERQRKDFLEAERKRQKAEYEAEQKVIKALGGTVTEWDNSMFKETEEIRRMNAMFDSIVEETRRKQIRQEEALEDELISSHQSYTDRKAAIDKDYQKSVDSINAAIAEAEKRSDNERVQALKRSLVEVAKERSAQQAQLSLSELREMPEYTRAYEDLRATSSETLDFLIQKFEEGKEAAAKNLNPEDLKEYTETIQQMKDVLMERDPFGSMAKSLDRLREAQKQVLIAQNQYEAVSRGLMVIKKFEADENGKLIPIFLSEADALRQLNNAKDEEVKASNNLNKSIASTLTAVEQLADGFGQLGNAIGGTTGDVISAIGSVADFTTSTIQSIQGLAKSATEGISGTLRAIEMSSAILAIASMAIQLFNIISKLFGAKETSLEKKLKEIAKATKAVQEYRLAVLDAQEAEKNWFGATNLETLSSQYEKSTEALRQYYEVLNSPQRRYGASKWTDKLYNTTVEVLRRLGLKFEELEIPDKTVTVKAETDEAMEKLDELQERLSLFAPVVTARQNLRIQIRHSTWFRSEKTADLEDWVKEQLGWDSIFDEDGLIDLQKAQVILDEYGNKLVGETKETLERLMELRKEYDKFLEDLRDYISSMFSPLSDNMTDAIWNWLETGENAMDTFKEKASDTFADVGKEMIKMFLNRSVFNQLSAEVESIYKDYFESGGMSEEDLMARVLTAYDAAMKRAEQVMPTAEELAKRTEELLQQRGLSTSSSRAEDKGATKIEADKITYEQANRIDGILTAMQIVQGESLIQFIEQTRLQNLIQVDLSVIRNDMGRVAEGIGTMTSLQERANSYLLQIQINTSRIPEIAEEVISIRRKINEAY